MALRIGKTRSVVEGLNGPAVSFVEARDLPSIFVGPDGEDGSSCTGDTVENLWWSLPWAEGPSSGVWSGD